MKKLLVCLALGLLATSCVPSTPQARIQQNPEMFAALSPKEQSLVQRGEIAKGMPPDAVVLAWGAPAMSYEGNKKGQASLRWDYTSAYPVYTAAYYGGYGYGGYGHHGRYGYYGYGFGPELTYVPYRSSSVWFVNNRVESWERLR
jgi:hypothetical protein